MVNVSGGLLHIVICTYCVCVYVLYGSVTESRLDYYDIDIFLLNCNYSYFQIFTIYYYYTIIIYNILQYIWSKYWYVSYQICVLHERSVRVSFSNTVWNIVKLMKCWRKSWTNPVVLQVLLLPVVLSFQHTNGIYINCINNFTI